MQKILIAAFFLLSMNAYTCEAQNHDSPSTHGMLMVGKEKIYLSHLPMFHSPHDYQVIVEAELDQPSGTLYLKNLNASQEKIYTLVPETFVLPKMIKDPKPFKAQIFQGHFERGGVLIADEVTVKIKKIVYFKKFNPLTPKPTLGQYILFGNEKEKFLAHEIHTKPDFDQILKVEAAIDLKNEFLPVVISSVKSIEPLSLGKELKTSVPLKLKDIIYFETGDLSF